MMLYVVKNPRPGCLATVTATPTGAAGDRRNERLFSSATAFTCSLVTRNAYPALSASDRASACASASSASAATTRLQPRLCFK